MLSSMCRYIIFHIRGYTLYNNVCNFTNDLMMSGPGSVIGTATAYGLEGPGIESRSGRDFPHLSRPVLRPTQPTVEWVPGLSRG